MKKFQAGDVAPETGFYKIINKEHKCLNVIFLNKGERLPPVNDKNCYYVLDF
ncbi:MAG: hypothetical protein IJA15_03605 [Clostridia bacterium]|nr:hypothetical protein [Clostridia bacterium]